jgi:hypothetical protein
MCSGHGGHACAKCNWGPHLASQQLFTLDAAQQHAYVLARMAFIQRLFEHLYSYTGPRSGTTALGDNAMEMNEAALKMNASTALDCSCTRGAMVRG